MRKFSMQILCILFIQVRLIFTSKGIIKSNNVNPLTIRIVKNVVLGNKITISIEIRLTIIKYFKIFK